MITTLTGILGSFMMIGSLVLGDLKLGLLGLLLCLSAAFLEGWVSHCRERRKAFQRAQVRRRGALHGWR